MTVVVSSSDVLVRIAGYERVRVGESWMVEGWSPLLFNLTRGRCDELVAGGVLRLVPNARGRTRYLLVPGAVQHKVTLHPVVQQAGEQGSAHLSVDDEPHGHDDPVQEQVVVVPDFSDIVGYEDIKELVSETVRLGARVHFMLVGPPGSAKTLFLLAIEEMTGASYVLGSRMSRSGLAGFLMDEMPRFLLIDEIDKLPARDLAPLLSLCEAGRVVEVLNRKRREETMDTVVFGAANSLKRLPAELLSRFQVLEFKAYERSEFIEVCKRVLVRREGLSVLEAGQVAVRVMTELRSKDIRTAVRVARLARTDMGIDGVVEIFKNYRPGRQ